MSNPPFTNIAFVLLPQRSLYLIAYRLHILCPEMFTDIFPSPIRQECHDDPLFQLLSHLDHMAHDGPGRDAGKDPLLVRKLLHHPECILILAELIAVQLLNVQDGRRITFEETPEPLKSALGIRLNRDNPGLLIMLLQPLAGPHERPSCPQTCNEIINGPRDIPQYLNRGRLVMGAWVSGVAVLIQHNIVLILLQHLMGNPDRPVCPLIPRREDDLHPIRLQDFPPLYAHTLGHDRDQSVPLYLCDHPQGYSGVTAGRFKEYLILCKEALLFSLLHHIFGNPVFDAPGRIKPLKLRIDLYALIRVESLYLHHRRIADGVYQGLV